MSEDKVLVSRDLIRRLIFSGALLAENELEAEVCALMTAPAQPPYGAFTNEGAYEAALQLAWQAGHDTAFYAKNPAHKRAPVEWSNELSPLANEGAGPLALADAFGEWFKRNPYEELTHATLGYMAFKAGAVWLSTQRLPTPESVVLGYGAWNTGANPGTRLIRYDGLVAINPERTDFYCVPVYWAGTPASPAAKASNSRTTHSTRMSALGPTRNG